MNSLNIISLEQLTYNYDLHHCFINYSLIFLNLYIYIKTTNNLTISELKTILMVFAIQLCILSLNSQIFGVSLIWCGLLGLSIRRYRTNKLSIKNQNILWISNLAALYYYYVNYHPVSTIVHFLAIGIANYI